jgi:hypothetical protein
MALICIWGFSYNSLNVFLLRRNRRRLINDAKIAAAVAQEIGFLIRSHNISIIEEIMEAIDAYLAIACVISLIFLFGSLIWMIIDTFFW